MKIPRCTCGPPLIPYDPHDDGCPLAAEGIRLDAEICICAAVRLPDGKVIRGHRHHDCLRTLDHLLPLDVQVRVTSDMQGFVTSRNRFVDRKEGLRLQLAAGIASVSQDGYRGDNLYSEDLY